MKSDTTQPYFVCIIDIWKWDIWDRKFKKMAEGGPALFHVKYKELPRRDKGAHLKKILLLSLKRAIANLLSVAQEELLSLLLASSESICHSVV